MSPSITILILVFLQIIFWAVSSRRDIEGSKFVDNRNLYILTCETRKGLKGFEETSTWNISSETFVKREHVIKINVCADTDWKQFKFLTKPIIYLEYIKHILSQSDAPADDYVILMDSDTFWNNYNRPHNNPNKLNALYGNHLPTSGYNFGLGYGSGKQIMKRKIFSKFDKVRDKKDIVISTEASCYVGARCNKWEVLLWYANINATKSYSMFLNSGLIMGKAEKLVPVLSYIISQNKSYDITGKGKFEDQKAFTDYTFYVAPGQIALDYTQELFASFPVFGEYTESYAKMTCKTLDNKIIQNCRELTIGYDTIKMEKEGLLNFNPRTCSVVRQKMNEKTPFYEYLKLLSLDPLVWHGNGVGKTLFGQYSKMVFDCHLRQMNTTRDRYFANYF